MDLEWGGVGALVGGPYGGLPAGGNAQAGSVTSLSMSSVGGIRWCSGYVGSEQASLKTTEVT